MHEKYRYRFNVSDLIDHYGGVSQTTEALQSAGAKIKRRSVQKWRERGTIPADALATLLMHGLRKGELLSLQGYIHDGEGNAKEEQVV